MPPPLPSVSLPRPASSSPLPPLRSHPLASQGSPISPRSPVPPPPPLPRSASASSHVSPRSCSSPVPTPLHPASPSAGMPPVCCIPCSSLPTDRETTTVVAHTTTAIAPAVPAAPAALVLAHAPVHHHPPATAAPALPRSVTQIMSEALTPPPRLRAVGSPAALPTVSVLPIRKNRHPIPLALSPIPPRTASTGSLPPASAARASSSSICTPAPAAPSGPASRSPSAASSPTP